MILIWLLLPMILILGIVTSYTDIREGKIRNKWILISLIYGVLVYTIFISYLIITGTPFKTSFFIETLINFFVALLIAVGFWLRKFWSAADGKLFSAFALLIPLNIYINGSVSYFPAINILINTFILIGIYLGVEAFRRMKISHFKKGMKEMLNPQFFLSIILLVFVIHWMRNILMNFMGAGSSFIFILMSVLFLVPILIRPLMNKKWIIILAVGLRILFDRSIFSTDFLIEFLVLVLLYFPLRALMYQVAYSVFSKKVRVKDLKEGMVLCSEDIKKKHSFLSGFETSSEELTKEDIKRLKKRGRNCVEEKYRKGENKVRVVEYSPFAQFIFIGVLMTLIFKGNIVSFLLNILS